MFAVSQGKLNGGEIFENGVANANAICAEITNLEYTSAFDIKVTGIANDKKDAKLALGAYVEIAGEYSYMQATDNGDRIGNYYFVSYNDIVPAK